MLNLNSHIFKNVFLKDVMIILEASFTKHVQQYIIYNYLIKKMSLQNPLRGHGHEIRVIRPIFFISLFKFNS